MFKIGDKVEINELFKTEYNEICKNHNWKYNTRIKKYEGIKEIVDILDGVIFFEKPDRNGNRSGLNEKYLQLVK